MIEINFYLDKADRFQQVIITGHAGYAESGSDIVCAAVSSQAIALENSLVHLLSLDVETEVNETEGGYLKISLPQIMNFKKIDDSQLLMKHFHLASSVLADNYPEYIKKTINKL